MTKIPENTQYNVSTTIPVPKVNIPEKPKPTTPKVARPPEKPTEAPQAPPALATPKKAEDEGSLATKYRQSTTIPYTAPEPTGQPVSPAMQMDRELAGKVKQTARRSSRSNFLDYFSDPIMQFLESNPSQSLDIGYNSPSGKQHESLGARYTKIESEYPQGKRGFSKVFKDNSGNPLPFQCGELMNQLTGSIVGTGISDKRKRIDPNIGWDSVKPGNTIVLNMGNYGHVANVLDTIVDANGNVIGVRVIEANKDLRGTINYGTYMRNNKTFLGFQNTSLLPKYATSLDMHNGISNLFGNG